MADNDDAEQPGGGSKKKLIIIISLVLVLLIGGGAAAALMLRGGDDTEQAGEDAEAEAVEKPAERHYFSLAPAFVVNFSDPGSRARYLKVELDAVTLDEGYLALISKHMPAIRNSVVLLLSQQTYEGLIEHEGKEALRATVLENIRGVLEENAGEAMVEDVYFTSFVMQ